LGDKEEKEMEIYSESEHIEKVLCPSCGEGNEPESRFCIHCGKAYSQKVQRFRHSRYILFGGMALLLAVAIGSLAKGVFDTDLVGKVNGEGITREELSKRVDRMKGFYEMRYGGNLFQGEEGTQNLIRLKAELLDEMVTEKLVLQEAKNAGYRLAPPEEIEKELETIKRKNGLSTADLEKMIGGKIEDFKAELGKEWIISQFVEKAVVKGNQQNGDLMFGQWLAKAKAGAKIETYEKLEPVSTAKASCCSSGSGGCGGGGKAQSLDPRVEQEAKAKGVEYYEKKTRKKGADAKVTNFGCHIQVDIIEDGKVILSLTYRQGEVQEI
jgi:predicted nucleic acid-binding Zn ribbon protein